VEAHPVRGSPPQPERIGPVRQRVAELRERLTELLPLAHPPGVPILTGTDTAGTLAGEIALLALDPSTALAAASTTAHRYLGIDTDAVGQPATLVTCDHDLTRRPRQPGQPAGHPHQRRPDPLSHH
jgi:hypothetical protein